MVIILYYGFISIFFALGGAYLTGYTDSTANLSATNISASEIDTGGIFGTGISFGRFVGLVTIGVGLADDTPSWFQTIFMVWQTGFLIFSVGWFISSIWNG